VSTVRLTPRATIQPCVYWTGAGEALSVLLSVKSAVVEGPSFREARSVPQSCQSCQYLEPCRGGCAGRRRIQNTLSEPDPYCPVVRGEMQKLAIRMAPAREFPKTQSACTTMVVARD
jgi:radical SAM protein with 4Fe4S-binding SPASM domain